MEKPNKYNLPSRKKNLRKFVEFVVKKIRTGLPDVIIPSHGQFLQDSFQHIQLPVSKIEMRNETDELAPE